MVQTTKNLPGSDRLFSYQSYSGIINTVQNAMYDGSVNNYGAYWNNLNSANNWQTTSGTPYLNFTKLITADTTGGQAFQFNGYNSYIQIQASSLGAGFNDIALQGNLPRFFGMRVYRSTWNTTAMEVLFYHKWGYVAINQVPGYLTYIVCGASNNLCQAQIALSSLSNGWHNLVFGYDGSFVYMNVDNGAFTNQQTAPGFSTHNLPNAAACSYFGCYATNAVGSLSINVATDVQKYFFTGAIKDFASWYVPAQVSPTPNILTFAQYYAQGEAYAQAAQFGVTYVEIGGLDYHFTFDNDTTTACYDVVQGIQAFPVNCTILSGSANTSGWYNSRALQLPFNNPGAGGIGFQGNTAIPQMAMNLATNYQWNLGMAIYGGNLGGTGTVTISVTDGTHSFSTNLSLAQLNVAKWQQFYWSFIPSQYGLAGNCYVQVKVTGTGSGTLYFDHIGVTPTYQSPYFDLIYQDPTVRGVYQDASGIYHGTQYTYAYIKNWSDVGSLPPYSQEIGTLGSTITLQLNRDPNAHMNDSDIQLNNRVLIQTEDPNNTGNGSNYFDGYIADRTFDFDNNYINLILASWGQQAQNFMLLAGSAPAVQNKFSDGINTPQRWATNNSIGLVLAIKTSPTQTTIAGLQVFMQTSQAGQADVLTCAMYNTLVGAGGYNGSGSGGALLNNGNLTGALAYVTQNHTYAASLEQINFTFNQPINVAPNTVYYFYLASQLQASAGGVGWLQSVAALDPNSSTYLVQGNNMGTNQTTLLTETLQYNLIGANNSSTVLYVNQDPATILQNAINNLRSQGANFNYTASSIDTVGQKITYLFQTATGADVLNTLPTLCPPGWFTYIDQTTNTIHLHAYSSRTVHKVLLGGGIQQLTLEQRMDTMVNTIYFTGGADPTNPPYNIFRFYQNAGSVAKYGVRMKVVTDNRVTSAATADIVAQSYLNVSPEIRTVIMITDKAYNIDTITIGDLINFGNFINGKVTNWDQSDWDQKGSNTLPQGIWDYDIAAPETLYLYIERIDNNVDNLKLTLSTTPPEVNKKVQQTLNSLLKQYTLNNPVTPTTGVNLIT